MISTVLKPCLNIELNMAAAITGFFSISFILICHLTASRISNKFLREILLVGQLLLAWLVG